MKKWLHKFLEFLSSVKLFFESFVDIAPDVWKNFKLLSFIIIPAIFIASLVYFVYQKFKD